MVSQSAGELNKRHSIKAELQRVDLDSGRQRAGSNPCRAAKARDMERLPILLWLCVAASSAHPLNGAARREDSGMELLQVRHGSRVTLGDSGPREETSSALH